MFFLNGIYWSVIIFFKYIIYSIVYLGSLAFLITYGEDILNKTVGIYCI